MSSFQSLADIRIYQEALSLARLVYALTRDSRLSRDYSLIDQIRRSCLSIPANIAEGFGRKSKKDFAQFISISLGSVNEVITYLDFIHLEYRIDTQELIEKYNNLGKQIFAFRKYLLDSSSK